MVFGDRDLLGLDLETMRQIRGRDISMIFQEPMTSLNPVFRVGYQIAEALRLHEGLGRRAARLRAIELLEQVGISDPRDRVDAYPHQLSGGMKQRVMIAMALACRPRLLIADEPTTALDVTIQAQILELLRELRDERGMGIILITHDLGVVAGMCDRVIVMYAGRIVEQAPTHALYADPQHPYTQALLRSVPRLDEATHETLFSIEGLPPRLDRGAFSACTFAPRCPLVRDACRDAEPALEATGAGRARRCVVPVEELS